MKKQTWLFWKNFIPKQIVDDLICSHSMILRMQELHATKNWLI